MHTVTIPEHNITKYIPEDLSECDAQQYIDMAGLIFLHQTGQLNYEEFRVQAIYKLMNMVPEEPKTKLKRNLELSEADENKYSNAYRLSELIDTFFDDGENNQKIIKQNFIHNPVKKFMPFWNNYYGPEDLLSNMKFGEYSDALRLFNQINANGELEMLFPFAAILYRKKKSFIFFRKLLNLYDGDIRQRYNSYSVDARAKVFENTPVGFVWGVYLMFGSFQKWLATAEIPWGGKVLDMSIIFTSEGNEEPETIPGIGMDAVMFAISESGVFGTKKELDERPLIEVLLRMYDIRKRDLELKKLEENAKSKSA
ncbi:hypothetical protein [Flavobacterium sp.]|jgi:hypothetical protein|uniref:hypothetical protein n=1 Tax=Flavobacterium sp. TaxID=239 RepID=UPI0037C0A677